MKSKDQIRKETPLSVTSTDNPIYETSRKLVTPIYDVVVIDGVYFGYKTDQYAELDEAAKLRLLQCDDDKEDNHYRWGDKLQKVIIADKYMKYVSGNIGPKE